MLVDWGRRSACYLAHPADEDVDLGFFSLVPVVECRDVRNVAHDERVYEPCETRLPHSVFFLLVTLLGSLMALVVLCLSLVIVSPLTPLACIIMPRTLIFWTIGIVAPLLGCVV